jgi:hypothetical protein
MEAGETVVAREPLLSLPCHSPEAHGIAKNGVPDVGATDEGSRKSSIVCRDGGKEFRILRVIPWLHQQSILFKPFNSISRAIDVLEIYRRVTCNLTLGLITRSYKATLVLEPLPKCCRRSEFNQISAKLSTCTSETHSFQLYIGQQRNATLNYQFSSGTFGAFHSFEQETQSSDDEQLLHMSVPQTPRCAQGDARP